jgi:phosphatidylserine/phosphatidylglycerophosphate/cardiolipin synthase-like enzyme
MNKKSFQSLKVSSSVLYTVLILIGFGAGVTTKVFVPLQPNPPAPQHTFLQNSPVANQSVSVCFTPNKQCQSQIISEINNAKNSIYVQAYSFTDESIAQALVDASKRGVNVKVLLDRSNKNDGRSAKDVILINGIPLRFDAPSGIAHNKVLVIDQATVITGSYNFSASAYKRNTENLLIINNQSLAQQYLQNWFKRWDFAKKNKE